jgi:hypothetical protein
MVKMLAATLSSKYQLAVPKAIRDELGLQALLPVRYHPVLTIPMDGEEYVDGTTTPPTPARRTGFPSGQRLPRHLPHLARQTLVR